jgi:glycosyltransferase involved in cell wall biosynthesis
LKKRIIVSVISDIVTDQRVQRECLTLQKMGFEVVLMGRKIRRRFPVDQIPYKTIRLWNPFKKGPLMYLYFNTTLFFFLLFAKTDLLWSNDLDTLLPNFLIARFKNIRLIYDSHEYFTASVYKKSSRVIWERLERYFFPKLKNVITVNESIRKIYEERYHVPVTVLRNVPFRSLESNANDLNPAVPGKKILIIQGMGINKNRGAEEAVIMMQYLPNDFNLYFIGTGTVMNHLRQMVEELKLGNKVMFIDPLPYAEMMKYTRQSFLGLIFERIDFSGEHLYALPNRFFDYVQAGIPVLSSRAVEIERLINEYDIGDFIDSFDPKEIAAKILKISGNSKIYDTWKHNTVKASEALNWQKEEPILIHFMEGIK